LSVVICTLAGAPKFGGKLSVHGPVSAVSLVQTGVDALRAGPAATSLNTTNTDSRSARSSDTTVKPDPVMYAAGSMPGCRLPERSKIPATVVYPAVSPGLSSVIAPSIGRQTWTSVPSTLNRPSMCTGASVWFTTK
jgi:hypothetical protein